MHRFYKNLWRLALPLILTTALPSVAQTQETPPVVVAATESTPSRAEYFTWINNVNEGSTEQQTLTNLAFFDWLKQEYGAQLDIYAWDVGQIDTGGAYGTMDSAKFKAHYPNGFRQIADKARGQGIAMGLWAGPDGFGNTPAEEQARIDLMVSLVRDSAIGLFKMDTYCTELRPSKQDAFIRMLTACRRENPNLILLNHRVNLGKAAPYATTSLWEGAETYIDVWMPNRGTAPHHRAGALSRGLPPNLTRLVEDHGVCLSSCLDYWEDDVVLQAFNRSLLLAPEIYGNPWLLRDDEYPRLARLFNLHHRYGDLLVHGMALPAATYGPNAVSRGDENTRLITLRNLTWNPIKYNVKLDSEIGLAPQRTGQVTLRRFHPTERDLGTFPVGSTVDIEVPPFRSYLLLATTRPVGELGLEGADYEVLRDTPGKPALMRLLGMPGSSATIKLLTGDRKIASARLDGHPVPTLVKGNRLKVTFPGKPLHQPFHWKLADLMPAPVPADAEALYEATCFAADNNALEVRQLLRSGPSHLPAVQAARDAFFAQADFKNRSVWDRAMFDDDPGTLFKKRIDRVKGQGTPTLRLDLGAPTRLDRLTVAFHGNTVPQKVDISSDLTTWTQVPGESIKSSNDLLTVSLPTPAPVRYVRVTPAPEEVAEVKGYIGNTQLNRSNWRGSNLFGEYAGNPAVSCWASTIKLSEAAKGSYFCIALNGRHGVEGAYAAVRVAGHPVGAPDRAVSYLCNPWEYMVHQTDSNYTYYVPVTPAMINKPIDVLTLTLRNGTNNYKPEVWISAYPTPYESHNLELEGVRENKYE